MKNETGDRKFPIWLLGDSGPEKWGELLDAPFDPRHPAVHNIWTPVIYNIQDILFRKNRMKIDEQKLFIMNAVKLSGDKPGSGDVTWGSGLNAPLNTYRALVNDNKPVIIFTFGSFAFEFARRVMKEKDLKKFGYWNTLHLGKEFLSRVTKTDLKKTNVIPLLHASIARGQFLRGHENFTGNQKGNYFSFTSSKIAHAIMHNEKFLKKICI